MKIKDPGTIFFYKSKQKLKRNCQPSTFAINLFPISWCNKMTYKTRLEGSGRKQSHESGY